MVIRLPAGPEWPKPRRQPGFKGSTVSLDYDVLFKGPAERALEFYQACREGHNGVQEGEPIVLVDGFYYPIYACS